MRLTLKLVDQRTKPATYSYSNPESEDYDRAELDLSGSASVVAGALRTLADDLEPAAARPLYGDVHVHGDVDHEAISRAFQRARRSHEGGVTF